MIFIHGFTYDPAIEAYVLLVDDTQGPSVLLPCHQGTAYWFERIDQYNHRHTDLAFIDYARSLTACLLFDDLKPRLA